MYDELIKNLRKDSASALQNCEFDFVHAWMLKAADAIEDLSKQRDLALARLCEWCGMCSKEHRDAWGCDDIARLQELQLPRWIPVTERLPNCNGCYLVWRPHFFGLEIGMPSICYFDGSNTWHDSYGVDFARILHPEDVTHWMPLPEPPESEGE